MFRPAYLVGCLVAVIVASTASVASAARVAEATCVGGATWTVNGTVATVDYHDITCYGNAVNVIPTVYPEWSAGGAPYTFSGVRTHSYSPIVGSCLGTLSYAAGTDTGTGLLKNDGNEHSLVQMVYTAQGAHNAVAEETYVGLLQNACSSSFDATVVIAIAVVDE